MTKPKAVLISDIHFNLNTLEIASKALKAAINKANKLAVPLIIAGDLHDSKAIIRAEVANRLIDLLSEARVFVYILVGNHDLINEKGIDHSLRYLSAYDNIQVVSNMVDCLGIYLIPYQSSQEKLKEIIKDCSKKSIIIMHQGFKGAHMGDYILDKSSIEPEIFKDFTVISGHYHRHQTLESVTYIGSPYTISFGEANDGPKGFLILNSDGSFTREILNLRRHIILEFSVNDNGEIIENVPVLNPEDLVWVKLRGPKSALEKIDKAVLGMPMLGHTNYKLDRIPTEQQEIETPKEGESEIDILDSLIDATGETEEMKKYVKGLYREIISS